MSARENYLKKNTLACLIELCVGKVTTVELRNESYATGRILSVDGFMNVTMADTKFRDASRRVKTFSSFYAPSRLIRSVQIPAEIDMAKQLEAMFDPKNQMRRGRGRGGGTFSGGRKKIMAAREKRRKEDAANAAKMLQEKKS